MALSKRQLCSLSGYEREPRGRAGRVGFVLVSKEASQVVLLVFDSFPEEPPRLLRRGNVR